MPKIIISDNFHFIKSSETNEQLINKYAKERLEFINKYSRIKVIKIGLSIDESAYSELYSAMDHQHVLLLQIVDQDNLLGNVDRNFIYNFLSKKICNLEESDFEIIYTDSKIDFGKIILKNNNLTIKLDIVLNDLVLQLLQQREEIKKGLIDNKHKI